MWSYKWSCEEDWYIFVEDIARQVQSFQHVDVCEEGSTLEQGPL
jgi:hypothetical protein